MNHFYNKVLKRFFDLLFAMVLSIVLSPLFLIISLLIFSEGKGPVIFKQMRVGVNGSLFYMYKFRSMVVDAPNVPSSELMDSRYITKLGDLLRRTSLDEIPQLVNILLGQMSFVGPRPFIPNEGLILELRKHNGVDTIRPGLTGWAQVKARETADHHYKSRLEEYYLNNMSLCLDVKILILTIFSIRGK